MAKILHLIPTLEGGGAERQLAMLANEQANRGCSVHIALRRSGPNHAIIRDGQVSIHPLGDLKGAHPLLIVRVGSLVRRIKPDVMQTWLPQMDIVGGLVAITLRHPWILSERSSHKAYQDAPLSSNIRLQLGRYATAIVANSPQGAAYWERSLTGRENVTTVANAVDVAAVRSAVPTPCRPAGERGHSVLFVGRLAVEKAPEIFITAFSRVAAMHRLWALIIGDGPLRDVIRASISASGLEKHVQILPFQRDWWGFLKTAAALVSTSRLEGQPNVVLEAMAAECPLIVSDIPPHKAILDERSALFVAPDDPIALSNAISSLLADPEAAHMRAKRAFERVALSTVSAAADGYERVYANVLRRQVP